MPHDAININNLPGELLYWTRYYSINGGPWVGPSAGGGRWRGVRITRPKSTKNPIRVDGSRAPSNWVANGGSWVCRPRTIYISASPIMRYMFQGAVVGPSYAWTLGTVPAVSNGLLNEVRSKALARFTERSVQANSAFRSLGKTLRGVGDLSRGMADSINRLALQEGGRKQFLQRKLRDWRKLPAAYLEYLYSWRNMHEDCADMFGDLSNEISEGYSDAQFTLRASKTLRSVEEAEVQVLDTSCWAVERVSRMQQCRVGYTFSLPSWWADELPVVSPFGNAWEQTPYSFVVDWFLPIGNWVGGIEALQLAPFFKEGYTSDLRRRKLESRRIIRYDDRPQGSIDFPCWCEDYSYVRTAVSSIYGEAFVLPSLRSPLSLDHAAQGLALLTQSLKRMLS